MNRKSWNKISLIAVCIGITLFSFMSEMTNSSEAKEQTGSSDGGLLLGAFNASGVELEQMTLHHGGALSNPISLQEGRETLDRLTRLYTWEEVNLSETNNDHPELELTAKWNDQTSSRLKLTYMADSGLTSTYLNFTVYTTEGSYMSMDEIQERMAEILQQFDILPQINTCITGFVNDTLDVDLQLALIGKIEEKLAVESVEGVQLENVISKSGYSPFISREIMTGNRPMNLQVATHVDRKEGRTVVTVGTPIITIEY